MIEQYDGRNTNGEVIAKRVHMKTGGSIFCVVLFSILLVVFLFLMLLNSFAYGIGLLISLPLLVVSCLSLWDEVSNNRKFEILISVTDDFIVIHQEPPKRHIYIPYENVYNIKYRNKTTIGYYSVIEWNYGSVIIKAYDENGRRRKYKVEDVYKPDYVCETLYSLYSSEYNTVTYN